MVNDFSDRELARGQRFEGLIRSAMERQGLTTMGDLSSATGIAKSTWHNWFQGAPPKRNSLRLAGPPLGLTTRQLMEPWESEYRVVQLRPEDIEDMIARGARRALEEAGVTAQTAQTGRTPVPPEVLREVGQAEADLGVVLDSETPHQPNVRREP